MPNRIRRTPSGWLLDGHDVRPGDVVEVNIDGTWRKAVVWFRAGVPIVLQRFGAIDDGVAANASPERLVVRWPHGRKPERGLLN